MIDLIHQRLTQNPYTSRNTNLHKNKTAPLGQTPTFGAVYELKIPCEVLQQYRKSHPFSSLKIGSESRTVAAFFKIAQKCMEKKSPFRKLIDALKQVDLEHTTEALFGYTSTNPFKRALCWLEQPLSIFNPSLFQPKNPGFNTFTILTVNEKRLFERGSIKEKRQFERGRERPVPISGHVIPDRIKEDIETKNRLAEEKLAGILERTGQHVQQITVNSIDDLRNVLTRINRES